MPPVQSLGVKTRMITFRLFKQIRMCFSPFVKCLCRRDMAEVSLRNIAVIDIQILCELGVPANPLFLYDAAG